MEYASSNLIHEHDAILYSLKILDEITKLVEYGKGYPISDILEIINFHKLIADKYHQGKEEELFFPELEEAGIQRQHGPIGMMIEEHEKGREFLKRMQASVSDRSIDRDSFVKNSHGYSKLLRSHIEKENTILFPISEMKISQVKHKELLKSFEKFEENVIGRKKYNELRKRLQDLNIKYIKPE